MNPERSNLGTDLSPSFMKMPVIAEGCHVFLNHL